MALVLRLQPGERVIALDGLGMAYEVELLQVGGRACRGGFGPAARRGGEPAARITLYLALTGREKFEWMLQKCTEVGAAAFVPVISSRSLVQDAAMPPKSWNAGGASCARPPSSPSAASCLKCSAAQV
jgi:16S rRNA (uracil1498-N3)-methyltransferase